MDQCIMRWVGTRAKILIGLLCLVNLSSLNASWPLPVDEPLPVQNSLYSQAAVDSDGNVTAVWAAYNETNWVIQAATKPFGGSWPSTIGSLSLSGQDAAFPQIVLDPAGNATVVWQRSDGSNQSIQSSTKQKGGEWQSVPDSLSQPGQDAIFPQIAVDSAGNVTAVWQRLIGGAFVIQSSTKAYGGSWRTTPDTLSLAGDDSESPQVAASPAGDVTVVWQQRPNGEKQTIRSSTKAYGGTWQATPDTLSLTGHDAGYPEIVVDANGNTTAVWLRLDGRNLVVQASTKPYGDMWQTTPDTLSLTGQDAIAPQIAIDGWGNCTVVWAYSNSIQASTKLYGSTWQTTPDELSLQGQFVASPRIAATSSGVTVVIWGWLNSTSGVRVVQGSEKPYGGTWQATPSDLSQSMLEDDGGSIPDSFPTLCLVIDSNGNSTALW